MQIISHKPIEPVASSSSIKGIEEEQILAFVEAHIKGDDDRKIVLSVDNKFSIDNLPNPNSYENHYASIVNLRKANDILRLTGIFCSINNRLELEGRFITCVETAELRKGRLNKKFPPVINSIYSLFDYLGKRVAPKLPILRNIYFFLTAGRNRVLTSVEVLGRLVYCGFKIIDTQKINNLLYIVVEKQSHQSNLAEKKYGFFFKMRRIGFKGKIINVYKIRTMHAYSEYLQDYIYIQNKLDHGGKFKNDYRVNFMGNLFRKLWLDELPMIYNWLKGEVKLVGVRPLSPHYLSLYEDNVKERRLNFKPGLIPPFYVDLPSTLEEIMASEMKYFDAYEKNPWRTDLNYFFSALKNIAFKNARSK